MKLIPLTFHVLMGKKAENNTSFYSYFLKALNTDLVASTITLTLRCREALFSGSSWVGERVMGQLTEVQLSGLAGPCFGDGVCFHRKDSLSPTVSTSFLNALFCI